METYQDILARISSRLKLPLILVAILGVIYLIELGLAGSFAYGAAYGYVTSLPDALDPLIAVVGPFLHSNHNHIFWNSLHLVILGGIVLIDESERDFLAFFLIAAWFTATIFPALAGGGRGFGISGATAALAGWAAVNRSRVWYRFSAGTVDTMEDFVSWRFAKIVILMSLPLAIFIQNIGQGIGLYEVKEGVSILGHVSGALFGIVFGLQELVRDRFSR